MRTPRYLLTFLLAMALCMQGLADGFSFGHEGDADNIPKHEMRGAWLATVYGIDWPARQGATADIAAAQKRELVRILDILKASGMNAVMFQVRSMADAMYLSSYEPWSQWLTGTRGTSPAKGWDPLAFAVEEAHARGMELHAWVNPFRLANGRVPEPTKAASGRSVFDPVEKGWVISFGRTERKKTKWVSILDPGNEAVRNHIVDVCREIVTKYEVDGLVFDDYFYPDRLPLGKGYDYDEWVAQCSADDGREPSMSQADWRRDNVAKTISAVSEMLRMERPWIRFGVSPAGVGGGNGLATQPYGLTPPVVGKDWMYDRIFCDPLRWLADGSVDYVSPQIYWARSHETNPYEPIAGWWADIALHFGRHCYPSQKVLALPSGTGAWEEQRQQVQLNRGSSVGSNAGVIFYSTAHITGKHASGLGEYLRETIFAYPALMPPMPWKEAPNPGAVKHLKKDGNRLSWYPLADMRYVVYAVPDDVAMLDALASSGANFMSRYVLGITYGSSFELMPDKIKDHWYAVAPYDRYGNEWEATIIGL